MTQNDSHLPVIVNDFKIVSRYNEYMGGVDFAHQLVLDI